MLVEVTKIEKQLGGNGRYYNTTVSFAIDPAKIETVQNVSYEYSDVGPRAVQVRMESGDLHVLKMQKSV